MYIEFTPKEHPMTFDKALRKAQRLADVSGKNAGIKTTHHVKDTFVVTSDMTDLHIVRIVAPNV